MFTDKVDPQFHSTALVHSEKAGPSENVLSGLLSKQIDAKKLLAEEKRTTEQFRMLYQTLRNEYDRLQENFDALQEEMKKVLEDSKSLNESSAQAIEKANKIIQQQQKEIEELQRKALNEESIKAFRTLKETEKNLKEWASQLETELDHYRKECSKWHFESTSLKSQLEYNEVENKRIVEAMKLRHTTEMNELQRKLDELLQEKTSHDQHGGQHLRTLQRENSKLQLKVKGLLTELEELRNKRERTGMQADNVVRLQTRQLTEHAINIRNLESELKSHRMQKEVLEKELATCYETNKTLSSQLQSAKMDIIHGKNQLEESQQKFQVEIADLKMENLKAVGKVERERNQLVVEIANLKLDIEAAREDLESAKRSIARKEEEWQRELHAIQYKSWEQCQKIEIEKKEVEEALKKSKKYCDEITAELQQSLAKVESELTEANKSKSIFENEILSQRAELHITKQELVTVEELKLENAALHKEISSLKQEKLDLQHSVEEYQQQLHKEKQVTTTLNHELQIIKSSLSKKEREESQSLIQQRLNLEKEREHFTQRIEELEKKLSEATLKMNTDVQNLKQKKQQYAQVIRKLRNKNEILDAKLAEIEIENEVLRKNIPLEVHSELKKELSNLRRQFDIVMALNQTKEIAEIEQREMKF